MSDLSLQILRAEHGDAAALSRLSSTLFPLGCPADTPPEDLNDYIRKELTPERFQSFLEDARIAILIVKARDQLAGYAMVARAAPPAHLQSTAELEVRKFYIDPAYHGRGVAYALMKRALEEDGGQRSFWLSVFSENARAIGFYQRCGFRIAGTQKFVVGTDHQTDYLMVNERTAELDATA